MTPWVRYAVAVVILFFAWKGTTLDIPWPPDSVENVDTPKPDSRLVALAEPLEKILPTMLPKDRQYLANLYDAMVYVLIRDGQRDTPIIKTTDQWVQFHSTTLQLAIDKASVGKYPRLGEAIDQTIINIVGADPREIDKDTRTKLTAACGVLSWVLAIHHE